MLLSTGCKIPGLTTKLSPRSLRFSFTAPSSCTHPLVLPLRLSFCFFLLEMMRYSIVHSEIIFHVEQFFAPICIHVRKKVREKKKKKAKEQPTIFLPYQTSISSDHSVKEFIPLLWFHREMRNYFFPRMIDYDSTKNCGVPALASLVASFRSQNHQSQQCFLLLSPLLFQSQRNLPQAHSHFRVFCLLVLFILICFDV